VDSFIGALGLDRSYTLLVVNPKWSPSLPSYTYRIGFSEPELRLLHGQVCCGQALYYDVPWWKLYKTIIAQLCGTHRHHSTWQVCNGHRTKQHTAMAGGGSCRKASACHTHHTLTGRLQVMRQSAVDQGRKPHNSRTILVS
jgi:hypothetical protein